MRLVDLFGLFHVDPRDEQGVIDLIDLLGEHLWAVHERSLREEAHAAKAGR